MTERTSNRIELTLLEGVDFTDVKHEIDKDDRLEIVCQVTHFDENGMTSAESTNVNDSSSQVIIFQDGQLVHKEESPAGPSTSLVIENFQPQNQGLYKCASKHANGDIKLSQRVNVKLNFKNNHKLKSDESYCTDEHLKGYCVNDGTCVYSQTIGTHYCVCKNGFHGQRCMYFAEEPIKTSHGTQNTHDKDRSEEVDPILATGMGIFFFFSLFTIMAAIIIIYIRRRRAYAKSMVEYDYESNMSNSQSFSHSIDSLNKPLMLDAATFGSRLDNTQFLPSVRSAERHKSISERLSSPHHTASLLIQVAPDFIKHANIRNTKSFRHVEAALQRKAKRQLSEPGAYSRQQDHHISIAAATDPFYYSDKPQSAPISSSSTDNNNN